jgi:hypothetical protein
MEDVSHVIFSSFVDKWQQEYVIFCRILILYGILRGENLGFIGEQKPSNNCLSIEAGIQEIHERTEEAA